MLNEATKDRHELCITINSGFLYYFPKTKSSIYKGTLKNSWKNEIRVYFDAKTTFKSMPSSFIIHIFLEPLEDSLMWLFHSVYQTS